MQNAKILGSSRELEPARSLIFILIFFFFLKDTVLYRSETDSPFATSIYSIITHGKLS